MIFDGIEFYNTEELSEISGVPGLRLQRFPEKVRNELGTPKWHKGRFRAERPNGCELRFVTSAGYFDLALTALEGDMELLIYCGDFFCQKRVLEAGKLTVLHIEQPEMFGQADWEIVAENRKPYQRFPSCVWRVVCGMNGYLHFHYLNTFGFGHRPPFDYEKPAKTWLAYGSSITCGSGSLVYTGCYIEQAALQLGWQVLNKGLSGSCYGEKAVADYLALQQADVISLEIGTNMTAIFSPEEYEERIYGLLSALKEKSTAEKIFVIDIFPNKACFMKDSNALSCQRYPVFKKIMRNAVEHIKDSRMISIEGEKILPEFGYLSADFLHPSMEGHIRMGQRLAKIMSRFS